MTYREAIVIVARASDAQRITAQHHPDRVLAKVARWPADEPAIWADVVAAVGVPPEWTACTVDPPVTLPGPNKTLRRAALRALWATKAWTCEELSAATGLSVASVQQYKRTVFRDCAWRSELRGKYQRAYQLIDGGGAP